MKGLELLKKGLLKQKSNEQDTVNNLCMIMEACGGYEQLMELPMSSINPILKYLELKQKKEDERLGTKKR